MIVDLDEIRGKKAIEIPRHNGKRVKISRDFFEQEQRELRAALIRQRFNFGHRPIKRRENVQLAPGIWLRQQFYG